MNRNRQGFTLLELLVVIGIMVILMTVAVANYGGIRRGAEMRGAVMTLRTTLMLARQEAVTKRRSVTVAFQKGAALSLPDMMNVIFSDRGRLITNSVIALPIGVQYDGVLPPSIVFKPSGSAAGTGSQTISVKEKQGAETRSVTVWFLTGITKD